jgi:hypothetical protein
MMNLVNPVVAGELNPSASGESIPKLDLWVEMTVQGRTVISGVISNHDRYPDGMRILSSAVEGYVKNDDGLLFALTKNSKYELGERIAIKDKSHFLKASASAMALGSIDKMTIC